MIASHGVLSGAAVDNVNKSHLTELVVTNTLPCSDKQAICSKLKTIDVSDFIAEGIRSIHYGESTTSLFLKDVEDVTLV